MSGVDTRDAPGAQRPAGEIADELRLVRKAALGDASAFERIVRDHAGLVMGLGMRLLRNRAEAEDLLQDVFLKVHGALLGFRAESSLKTWIAQVTINAARNRARGERRRTRHLAPAPAPFADGDPPPSLAEQVADTAAGPERMALSTEARERIETALAALPEEFREALVLREIEGLSHEEIAVALSVPIGTVKSRIARGRLRLADALADLAAPRRDAATREGVTLRRDAPSGGDAKS